MTQEQQETQKEESRPRPAGDARQRPLLVIRPLFDQRLAVAEAVVYGSAAAAFVTVAGGTLVMLFLILTGLNRFIPATSGHVLLGIGSFFLLPGLYFERKRKGSRRDFYAFYPGYLRFECGLLSRRRQNLPYNFIRDVRIGATFLQGVFGYSRLELATTYPVGRNLDGFIGLRLPDLKNTAEIREQVVAILSGAVADTSAPPAAETPSGAQEG